MPECEYFLLRDIDSAVKGMKRWIEDDKISKKTKRTVWTQIHAVLCFWTSFPSVGVEKSERLKKAYNEFYETLYELLAVMKKSSNEKERQFAENALYQGVLYRYLGYGKNNEMEDRQQIVPVYDGIYVSWSKSPSNDYVLSRLNGPVTHLSCKTGERYGIDIHALGYEAGGVEEVVFPMLEDHILSKSCLNFVIQ